MTATLLAFFEWMESTPLGQAIRHSASLIALLEIVHLIGLTLLLGTILMVDLSLLGRGIGRHPAARIARELNRYTLAGLAILLISGPVLLSSEAIRCYKTPSFWVKMALLAIALLFHFTVHRRVALADPPVAHAGRVAVLSLAGLIVSWLSVRSKTGASRDPRKGTGNRGDRMSAYAK